MRLFGNLCDFLFGERNRSFFWRNGLRLCFLSVLLGNFSLAAGEDFPEWIPYPAENAAGKWFSEENVLEIESLVSFGIQTGEALSEKKESVVVTIFWSNGEKTEIRIRPSAVEHELKGDFEGQVKGTKIQLADAVLILSWPGKEVRYWVRPNIRCFHSGWGTTPKYFELLKIWNSLPGASEHSLKFELRKSPGAAELFLDGSFIETIPAPKETAEAQAVRVSVEKKGAFAKIHSAGNTPIRNGDFSDPANARYYARIVEHSAYYPLDFPARPRVRTFAEDVRLLNGHDILETAWGTFKCLGENRIPFLLAPAERSSDVGICREGQGNWALEVDEYLRRQPTDGFPSSIHFRVPARPYFRAWVVLAFDDSQKELKKDRFLTVRLTKYLGDPGVGNGYLADTTKELTPEYVEKFREPELYVLRDGRKLPVYRVPVELDLGKITDLAVGRSWRDLPNDEVMPTFLDVEFFGKPKLNFHQTDDRSKPDPDSVSAIQILGATLESAPVGLDIVESQPGNVFLPHEKKEVKICFRPDISSFPEISAILRCSVRDFEGRKLHVQEYPCPSVSPKTHWKTASGELPSVTVPLEFPTGFYWLDLECAPKKPRPDGVKSFFTVRSSFSILPKDERRAGYDSPYGLWWFKFVHFVPGDTDFVGSLMKKCGARNAYYANESEEAWAKYQIGKRQITLRSVGNFKMLTDDKKDVKPEFYAQLEEWMEMNLEKYPHLQEVCVFHESGPGADYPYELWGEKQVWQEGQEERHRQYGVMAQKAGEFMKKNYPQIKLAVGNSGSSIQTIGAVTRWGIDPRFVDFVGTEATGQQAPPEKPGDLSPVSIHAARETAKVFTGRDYRGTCCYEFTSRTERTLGWKRQAQWYVRDALVCLSNGFSTLGNGEIIDPGNCYHNTLWGNAGLLQRGPYCFPKPAYQAFAVLTNVLDQVRVKRRISTGAATVYAVEFNRFTRKAGEGTFATVFWCARGEGKLRLEAERGGSVRLIDMMGREKKLNVSGSWEIPFSESPCYVISDFPFAAAKITERSFPEDFSRFKLSEVVCPLADLSADGKEEISLMLTEDAFLDSKFDGRNAEWPIRRKGNFELTAVNDQEKGLVVEISLAADDKKEEKLLPGTLARPADLVTRYVRLEISREKSPLFSAPKHGLGIWVDGNSGWGRIMFELEDENGNIVRSTGVGGWGCDSFDWPGFMSINFDGWNFIALPTRDSEAFDAWGPQQAAANWNGPAKECLLHDEAKFRLKALIVEMNVETLGLTGTEKVKNKKIRLKDFSVF